MSSLPTNRHRLVHFRSRVRIASSAQRGYNNIKSNSSPSRSSSPSSSISVPLHSTDKDTKYNPAFGPLGRRVSFFAWKRRCRAGSEADGRGILAGWEWKGGNHWVAYDVQNEERTPLVKSANHQRMYSLPCSDPFDPRQDAADDARLAREMDVCFGKWPARLMNRHVCAPFSSFVNQLIAFTVVAMATRAFRLLSRFSYRLLVGFFVVFLWIHMYMYPL
jgi:hypothetical protein